MDFQSRSPQVVAAHFFAKYGYDDSLKQVSSNLGPDHDQAFWKEVVDILDDLRVQESKGLHPCAALPPKYGKPRKPSRH